MSELSTPAPAATAPGPLRTAARWMVTFVGFPLGGLTTDLLLGPVDSPVSALLAGWSPAASWARCSLGVRPEPAVPGSVDRRHRRRLMSAGHGHLVWSTSGPAWPTWPSRGPCAVPPSAPPSRGPAAAARAACPRLAVALSAAGRRLDDHRRRRREVTTVRRLRLQRPIVATALTAVLPILINAARRPRHDPPRRLVAPAVRPSRREQLAGRGVEVVASTQRTGRSPGARARGDATDPAFTTRAAAVADVVYFCLNAMNYTLVGSSRPATVRGRRRPGRRRSPVCSTTSTPTALRRERTSSSPSRPGRPRPRPRPGPP